MSEDPAVDEAVETDCEAVVESQAEPEDEATQLDADDEQALKALEGVDDDEAIEGSFVGGCLGPPGGGWGGAQAPVDRAVRIGRSNGVPLFSRKRSSANPGSDHHPSQTRSDACDLSNGTSPTPQMDRTARQIAALCGHPNWGYGNLVVHTSRYRLQLLYRTNLGGNHYNHVHVGIRMR